MVAECRHPPAADFRYIEKEPRPVRGFFVELEFALIWNWSSFGICACRSPDLHRRKHPYHASGIEVRRTDVPFARLQSRERAREDSSAKRVLLRLRKRSTP
jgi:hypothetical protein